MTDVHSPEQRSYNMSRIRSKNSKPELAVRHIVYDLGFRYRIHKNDLPGNPDLVFPHLKKVIFVNGCFWHRHNCPNGKLTPKNNADYWQDKFKKTISRDNKHSEMLATAGWDILIIWECEVKDTNQLTTKIKKFLSSESV
ncbi:MAG: DNA mismatch endonuclease Vsr [Dehalococcoidales bacterium]|nr:DNA mismatch endonuclease Vsr [Dehalococcoidales bacterium]